MHVIQYPTICVVGPKGTGKTATMTWLAYYYSQLGYKIFANFELIGIPYQRIEFSDIIEFPEYLTDGIILIDEAHVGTDAYNFFNSRVKGITDFATQTRKKRLIFIYTTQVFSQVAKRLRDLTDYFIYPRPIDDDGSFYIETHDREQDSLLKGKVVDLSPYFDMYNTNEIIVLPE